MDANFYFFDFSLSKYISLELYFVSFAFLSKNLWRFSDAASPFTFWALFADFQKKNFFIFDLLEKQKEIER